ncbi:MAG: efflux RND transporter permease subunit [Deltaproteobacteria bacterium]|nr:efflux RND transporter permease subunit [Deltaproteobacteria bacterium]
MIARLVELCARRPVVVLLLAALLGYGGYRALDAIPVDALPDLSETQVIITAEWSGRSPDLVEAQVTWPLSTALLSTPRVKAVRGQSFFGIAFVYAIFEDGTDLYWARSRVLELVSEARARLPEGVDPVLGPDATAVGWVFQYALVDRSGNHSLADLRATQDTTLRLALESVPGVAEVASIGGFVKQYQVALHPEKLVARGVSLETVVEAVRGSNADTGGETVEIAGHEQMVRGRAFLANREDLANVPVMLGEHGVPVLLSHLGDVTEVPAPRRGVAELDGQGEAVGGIIVMRHGENALAVIERVKQRLAEVAPGLPAGMRVEVVYDRSDFIQQAIGTLKKALVEEMIVVSLVILIFLLHVRSALVPIVTLPLAVLAAFIPMMAQGLGANVMSLAGIIVAIGDMVDGSIVIVENVHKRLEQWEANGRPGERKAVVIAAMREVAPSIFGSLLVLTVAFIPVLSLQETEGRLFGPLAWTKTWSMGFAALLAVTLTPALVALVVRGRLLAEHDNVLNRLLVRAYTPVVRFTVRHRGLVIGLAVMAMVATVPAFLRLEGEFMPPLEETDLLYMPTSPPGMSETVAIRTMQTMNDLIRGFPEVAAVFGKAGRAETATDPAPLSMFETVIRLEPRDRWRDGKTLDDLRKELDDVLTFPGMPNLFWMPVQTRTEMLSTGIRSNLGVKIFGPDQATIERTAAAIEAALGPVRGTRRAFAEREAGGFYVDVVIDRLAAARWGLSAREINMVIETAIAGMPITRTVEGLQRYPVSIRYAREYRDDPAALERVLVPTMSGRPVPLGSVAKISTVTGPMMIRSEAGQRVGFVFVDVDSSRGLVDYVAEAKKVVAASVTLPPGVRVAWAGQFEAWERASDRLALVVPLTLLLIVLLLWWNTRSWIETGIVLLAVPFSLIGAIWALYLMDYNLSVAVAVGLIALAGLDAETGVVMLLYLTLSHRRRAEEGRLQTHADLLDAIVEGAAQRIRPKLMTILVNIVGLAPVLWSDGVGSDVMKRIAVPLFGGVITSFLLELTVYPAVFAAWKGYRHAGERAGLPLPVRSEAT